jgi:predicted RNA-binding protein YlqC (UPF0109 family)
MPEHEEIRQWVLKTVQLVVDHPEVVRIETETVEERTKFLIKADPRDVGKVIGRQGRTSQSLRVLAGAMAKKLNWRFIVEIEEGNKSGE